MKKELISKPNETIEVFENRNIYGKEKYPPEKAREKLKSLIDFFKSHYSGLGYAEEMPTFISTGIDKTVRFVGSPISVLKKYLSEKDLPDPGIFLQQDCIRTQNTKRLLDDKSEIKLASYFPGLSVISRPEHLQEACREILDFLKIKLQIPDSALMINISRRDDDLVRAVEKNFDNENIQYDSKPEEYYRHVFGMEGVSGRNLNLSLKNTESHGYTDIGNLIVIEKDNKQIGVETALGPTIILKQIHGLDHTLDCTPITGLELIENSIRRKFEDALVTTSVLFREGLRPFGGHNRNRILKQYIRSLSYFRGLAHLDLEALNKIIHDFETSQFPEMKNQSNDMIIEYLKCFEEEIKSKHELTKDEDSIIRALKLLD